MECEFQWVALISFRTFDRFYFFVEHLKTIDACTPLGTRLGSHHYVTTFCRASFIADLFEATRCERTFHTQMHEKCERNRSVECTNQRHVL